MPRKDWTGRRIPPSQDVTFLIAREGPATEGEQLALRQPRTSRVLPSR